MHGVRLLPTHEVIALAQGVEGVKRWSDMQCRVIVIMQSRVGGEV